MRGLDPELLKAVALSQAEQQRRQKLDGAMDYLREQLASSFEKGTAYSNLIMLGGYAGFFGLWQLAKDFIAKGQALVSVLLMLISVATFVLFEIWKMYSGTKTAVSWDDIRKLANARAPLEELDVRIKEQQRADQNQQIRFGRVWRVSFALTVLTGFGAIGVLAYALVAGLLKL